MTFTPKGFVRKLNVMVNVQLKLMIAVGGALQKQDREMKMCVPKRKVSTGWETQDREGERVRQRCTFRESPSSSLILHEKTRVEIYTSEFTVLPSFLAERCDGVHHPVVKKNWWSGGEGRWDAKS